jgi:hypothetical protein
MNNSECVCGFYHHFVIVEQLKGGVVERCLKCRKKIFFRNDVPNHIYLSYHLRSILQPSNKRFKKEFNKLK